MSSAAAAVADVIAPPPQAAEARRAPNKADDPSFKDHLDTTKPRERPDTKEAKASRPAHERKTDTDQQKTDANDAAVAAQAAPVQPPPAPTAAPALLQLLANQDTDAQGADEVAPEIAQAAPTGAKAGDCAPPPLETPAPTAPAAYKTIQPEHAHTQTFERSDAKAKGALTKTAEPPAPAPETTPAPQPSTEQTQAAAQVAPTTPATQTQEPRPTSQRATPAIDAARTRGAAKADAPTAEVKADPKADTGRAKTDPPNAKALAAAFRDSLAAAAEAHDLATPAPAPTQSTPTQTLATSAAPIAQTSVDPLTAARATPAAAAQVGHEIIRRFDGKSTHFDMRLDPPELGRVDIKLEVSRDHRVTAVVSADSPQALTELARHARELEQTLQSAGLELADNGLSFDLNQSRQGFADTGDDRSSNSARAGAAATDTPEPAAIAARPLGLESWRGVRVDVTA